MGRKTLSKDEQTNSRLRRLLGVRIKNTTAKFGLDITFIQCTELIGDINEARIRVESLFRDGMTWENRKRQWHLDHIQPLGLSKSQDDFRARCHYSNIQPLWKIENIIKGYSGI